MICTEHSNRALHHNSDRSRIETVTELNLERVEQYAAAIRLLEG